MHESSKFHHFFGACINYDRFLASFLDDDLAVRAFTQLHVSHPKNSHLSVVS